MKVWLPSWLMWLSMSFCMTRIAVITTMIENTPTNTPSRVRAERNLCAVSAPMAMKKLSRTSASRMVVPFRAILFVPQGIDHVHSCGAPCGKKTRNDTSNQRDNHGDGDDGEGKSRGHEFLHH